MSTPDALGHIHTQYGLVEWAWGTPCSKNRRPMRKSVNENAVRKCVELILNISVEVNDRGPFGVCAGTMISEVACIPESTSSLLFRPVGQYVANPDFTCGGRHQLGSMTNDSP